MAHYQGSQTQRSNSQFETEESNVKPAVEGCCYLQWLKLSRARPALRIISGRSLSELQVRMECTPLPPHSLRHSKCGILAVPRARCQHPQRGRQRRTLHPHHLHHVTYALQQLQNTGPKATGPTLSAACNDLDVNTNTTSHSVVSASVQLTPLVREPQR